MENQDFSTFAARYFWASSCERNEGKDLEGLQLDTAIKKMLE